METSLLIFQLLSEHLLEKIRLAWEAVAQYNCVLSSTVFKRVDFSREARLSPVKIYCLSGTARYKPASPPRWRHCETIIHKATIFSLSGRIFTPGQHFILGFGSVVEVELLSNF